MAKHTMQDLGTFCKKKGYLYRSSEIYGGVAGLYDYGHLGTKLKKNFEDTWRNYFLKMNDNFFEIETANIQHEKVFVASGHLENFVDPIAHCSKCDHSERADHLVEKALKKRVEDLKEDELSELIKKNKLKCPECGSDFKPVTKMNMMFPLNMGVGAKNVAYLRPETAQSPYVNFKTQFEIQRKKLPMGLALIGRAYRNEISPRNLTIRQREFTQAELQIFFNHKKIEDHEDFESIKDYKLQVVLAKDRDKGDEPVSICAGKLLEKGLPKFYVYHLAKIQQFYFDVIKIPKDRFRMYQLNDKEKAFYNKYHFDLEIKFEELGYVEVGGLHYRTDHDLGGHQKVSKEKMEVLDESTGDKIVPHVLELSFGVDRNVLALIDIAYVDDKERGNIVLKLDPVIAPIQFAVLPLVNKLDDDAYALYSNLKYEFDIFYDKGGSVGRRYARADENGIPYCITYDFDSKEKGLITIRDRDTAKQARINMEELEEVMFLLSQGIKTIEDFELVE